MRMNYITKPFAGTALGIGVLVLGDTVHLTQSSAITATAVIAENAVNLDHGHDKFPPHPEREPAPVLKSRMVTFASSARALPHSAALFLRQFVMITGSGHFPLA